MQWSGYDVQLTASGTEESGAPSSERQVVLHALPSTCLLRDAEGYLPGLMLLSAAERGDEKLASALLHMRVMPYEADAQCNTPLHYASMRNHLGIVR